MVVHTRVAKESEGGNLPNAARGTRRSTVVTTKVGHAERDTEVRVGGGPCPSGYWQVCSTLPPYKGLAPRPHG